MGPGCHGELKEEFAMRSQVDRRVLSSRFDFLKALCNLL